MGKVYLGLVYPGNLLRKVYPKSLQRKSLPRKSLPGTNEKVYQRNFYLGKVFLEKSLLKKSLPGEKKGYLGNVYGEEFTGKNCTWETIYLGQGKNIYPMGQDFLYKGKVYLEQSGKRSIFTWGKVYPKEVYLGKCLP